MATYYQPNGNTYIGKSNNRTCVMTTMRQQHETNPAPNEHNSHQNQSQNNGNTSNSTINITPSAAYRSLAGRPASKTVQLVKQRRSILEQLKCHICKGYIIDAVTIGECMDSFCRSCIVKHLASNCHCPKCGALVHEAKPMTMIRPDKVLQDIIYKLVPGLYDREMSRRREFYQESDSDDDHTSSSPATSNSASTVTGVKRRHSGETYGLCATPKPYFNLDDHINMSLEYRDPHFDLQRQQREHNNRLMGNIACGSTLSSADKVSNSQLQLHYNNGSNETTSTTKSESTITRRYLRCPVMFTMMQLRRFVAAKYGIENDASVRLYHQQDVLADECTLLDVAYIYDWKRTETLRLYFSVNDHTNLNQTVSETSQQNTSGSSLVSSPMTSSSSSSFSTSSSSSMSSLSPLNGKMSAASIMAPAQAIMQRYIAPPLSMPPPPPPAVSSSSSLSSSSSNASTSIVSSMPPSLPSLPSIMSSQLLPNPSMMSAAAATTTSITSVAGIPQTTIHATTSSYATSSQLESTEQQEHYHQHHRHSGGLIASPHNTSIGQQQQHSIMGTPMASPFLDPTTTTQQETHPCNDDRRLVPVSMSSVAPYSSRVSSEHTSFKDYSRNVNTGAGHHRSGLVSKGASSTDVPMAFSIVTEKGITIVRSGSTKSFMHVGAQETTSARIERQQTTTVVRNVVATQPDVGAMRDTKRPRIETFYS